jgi:hypothetical protein
MSAIGAPCYRYTAVIMRQALIVAAVAAVGLAAGACGRDSEAAPSGSKQTMTAPNVACGHAVCADDFFIDATPSGDCAPGASCNVGLSLVATGAFHINDEYPYRFKADDAPGVRFLGTDAAGANVFSKAAGDWHKADAKSGAMTVKFTPSSAGSSTITGTLKLSVCSEANCLLEQRQVSTAVAVK